MNRLQRRILMVGLVVGATILHLAFCGWESEYAFDSFTGWRRSSTYIVGIPYGDFYYGLYPTHGYFSAILFGIFSPAALLVVGAVISAGDIKSPPD